MVLRHDKYSTKIVLKRVFDFTLSLIGIFISLPLWILIGFLIFLEDGFPVFYSQIRVGKNGKTFRLWKFRSMRREAERETGAVWAEENDPRVTKVGRVLRSTAMDELPQLINIFKGEMSFVGPRAERPELVLKFTQEFQQFNSRHVVTPGLTGVAQILGSAYLDYKEKYKYDMWYIKNYNYALDTYLIFLSFLISFNGKWVIKGDKFNRLAKKLKCKVEKGIHY